MFSCFFSLNSKYFYSEIENFSKYMRDFNIGDETINKLQ